MVSKSAFIRSGKIPRLFMVPLRLQENRLRKALWSSIHRPSACLSRPLEEVPNMIAAEG